MKTFLQPSFLFLQFIWQQLQANQWRQSAAALTYTSLFALVPMMTVCYALLSFMPQLENVQGKIESLIFDNFLPDTGSQIQVYLQQFSQQARSLTLPGIVILFVTALMMLKTIENAFNAIWDVKEGRKGIASFLLYWAVLSLGPLLAGSALIFSTYLLSLSFLSGVEQVTGVQQFLGLLPFVLSTCALGLMYCAIPNCTVPLKNAFIGALVTALVFGLVKNVFVLGIQHSSYALIYGAFAAVPLFLMWIYLCWMIILFGAVLVRSLTIYSLRSNSQQVPIMLALKALQRLWVAQQSGQALSTAQLLQETSIGIGAWEGVYNTLTEQRYIQTTTEDKLILCRDLNRVSLWDLQQLFHPAINININIEANTDSRSDKNYRDLPTWHQHAITHINQTYDQSQQHLSLSLETLFNTQA